MHVQRLPFDALDGVLWGLQVIVLVLAWPELSSAPAADRRSGRWEIPAIAFLAAATWRLTYAFVLASAGFGYLVPDDVARWLLSWQWSEKPYLITWDGIWQGGTFYLHGSAMAVLRDPLVASKLISVGYNLLALLGILVLTQAIYRNARLSSLAVVAAAPWWLHILLGTGTMTEMPVTGLMLGGAGLLLIALDAKTSERSAGRALLGAAACFLAATTFHLVAWMMLAALLLVFAAPLLSNRRPAVRRRLGLFLGISAAYCVVWILGCWIKFGSPLAFLGSYGAYYAGHGLSLSPAKRAAAYPLAFLYGAWLVLPAVAAGVLGAVAGRGESAGRERRIVAAVALTLAILTASAIVSSPSNVLPIRSVVTPVAALFPIAVAGIARAWPSAANRSARARKIVSVLAILALAVAWVTLNHARTFQRVRSQGTLDPDAVATGAWLREAMAQPNAAGHIEDRGIVHVWVPENSLYPSFSIEYLFGLPGRIRPHSSTEPMAAVLSSVRAGELLVTDRPLPSTRFERVVTIGRYGVYRAGR
jgi:hypothetical protein